MDIKNAPMDPNILLDELPTACTVDNLGGVLKKEISNFAGYLQIQPSLAEEIVDRFIMEESINSKILNNPSRSIPMTFMSERVRATKTNPDPDNHDATINVQDVAVALKVAMAVVDVGIGRDPGISMDSAFKKAVEICQKNWTFVWNGWYDLHPAIRIPTNEPDVDRKVVEEVKKIIQKGRSEGPATAQWVEKFRNRAIKEYDENG